jgi:hypothetical protein
MAIRITTNAGKELFGLYDTDGVIQSFLDQWYDLGLLRHITEPVSGVNGRTDSSGPWDMLNVGYPVANETPPPRPEVNTLYVPTGATRWSIGYFLVHEDDVLNLQPDVAEDGSSGTDSQVTLQFSTSPGVWSHEYLLHAAEIIQVSATERDRLFIAVMVDARYFWQFAEVFTDEDIESRPLLEWDDVLGNLYEKSNAIDSRMGAGHPPIGAGVYLVPSAESIRRPHHNLATAMEMASHSTGGRLIPSHGLNGLTQASMTASASYLGNNKNRSGALIAGDDADGSTYIAAEVHVVFPILLQRHPIDDGGSLDPDLRRVHTVVHPVSDFYQQVKTVPGTVKTIFTKAYAMIDEWPVTPGDPLVLVAPSDTDVPAIASALAADYYATAVQQYSYVYAGLLDWEVGPSDDFLFIRMGTENKFASYPPRITTTTIKSLPPNWQAMENCSTNFDRYADDELLVTIAAADTPPAPGAPDIPTGAIGNVTIQQDGEDVKATAEFQDWFEGDKAYIRWFHSDSRWRIMGPASEVSIGVIRVSLLQEMTASTTVQATVIDDPLPGITSPIDVTDFMIGAGEEPLAPGTPGTAALMAGTWYLISARCPAPPDPAVLITGPAFP